MSVINTNTASLNAQRNLSSSSAGLTTSLQRLSSGLRINSAKDDAAGLAISERMTSQIRGLNQASRNANDGISLAQTAEGALGEIGNNLQRIRELAVQSRNGTNSTEDRAALQKEVDQLKSEIGRVAKDTEFNGIKLLNGKFTDQAFQVGANQGQTINISQIANASTDTLGSWNKLTKTTGAAPVGTTAGGAATPASKDLTLTASIGGDGTSSFTKTFAAGSNTLTLSISGPVDATSVAAELVSQGFNSTTGAGNVNGFSLDLGGAADIETALTTNKLKVTRTDGANFTAAESTTGTAYGTAPSLSSTSATTDGVAAAAGGAASFTAITAGQLTINGKDIIVGTATTADNRLKDLVTAINGTKGADVTASIEDGKLKLVSADSSKGIKIAGSADATTMLNQTGLAAADLTVEAKSGFDDLSIKTADDADNAILAMDAALKAVNEGRADLGAVQNRFASVVNNVQTTTENLSASRSRIQDTDFAAETANMTRSQILQQAGTAMLAQANQLPNGVMALLRG